MVWAASDLQLLRVDPSSGRIVTRLEGGLVGGRTWNFGSGLAVLAVPGRSPQVWWASSAGLFKVDPRRNLLAGTIPMPAGVTVIEGMAAGKGGLWAITDSGVVHVDHRSVMR
jgi:ligand-binding sensor domain-containing protein